MIGIIPKLMIIIEELIDVIETGDKEKLKTIKAELHDARRSSKQAWEDLSKSTKDGSES